MRALGALAVFDVGMFTFAAAMHRRQAANIRRAEAKALQLDKTADNAPHGG